MTVLPVNNMAVRVDDFGLDEGVIMVRRGGEALTNVPHKIVHHSPTGFEWNYAGSGPTELALNIVAHYVDDAAFTLTQNFGLEVMMPRARILGGRCAEIAWDLHQDFKWDAIAKVPHEGGFIAATTIQGWIFAQLHQRMKSRAQTKE